MKVHINELLNVGGTSEELIETIFHIAAYAGYRAALNAMFAARDVLAERSENEVVVDSDGVLPNS